MTLEEGRKWFAGARFSNKGCLAYSSSVTWFKHVDYPFEKTGQQKILKSTST